MPVAEEALRTLADQLRGDDSVISPHVAGPGHEAPALGLLAAAGPSATRDPGEYALGIETIREGYLLHYGRPRVIAEADEDLTLLAGDYLYARGLERLAALGDLAAIRELADLISMSSQLHAEGREGARELWLASVTTVAAATNPAHEQAKDALRNGEEGAAEALWRQAVHTAKEAGIGDPLGRAAEAIGFQPQ
ncbi:MAG TPA: hypothetical protein VH391_02515 [Solirubrobacterales bacterium]